jgi:hypothetical protein
MTLEFLLVSPGFIFFFCSGMSKTLSVCLWGGGVGGYKMHICIANIPIFHSRYRRYVFITNVFHEFL